jgi:hypothetical protein
VGLHIKKEGAGKGERAVREKTVGKKEEKWDQGDGKESKKRVESPFLEKKKVVGMEKERECEWKSECRVSLHERILKYFGKDEEGKRELEEGKKSETKIRYEKEGNRVARQG